MLKKIKDVERALGKQTSFAMAQKLEEYWKRIGKNAKRNVFKRKWKQFKELGELVAEDETVSLEKKIKEVEKENRRRSNERIQIEWKVCHLFLQKFLILGLIDWMINLPWNKRVRVRLMWKSKANFDHDHLWLKKVKERILEYLSVRKLINRLRSDIMFFWTPGVGKTSIGKSIAKSLDVNFIAWA